MANKRGKLNEGDLRLVIRDLPDEIDAEMLSVDVEAAPGGDMEDMEDMEDMGGEELDLDLGMGDEGTEGLGAEEPEMPDLEEMDVAVDVDLPDDVEVDPEVVSADVEALDDEEGGELDLDMGEPGEEELDMDDEVVEISESMLRKELQRLKARRLNEADHDVSNSPKEYDGTGHGPEQEDQFGGGTGTGEPFVDRDDADLNTLGENELSLEAELAELDEEEDAMTEEEECGAMGESKKRKTRALNEKIKSYKVANNKLKRQLVEANLFNAKLVYANKLLSNQNLSQKQRATIVNALDGAESIKEVKKLYAHLNEALSGKKKGKLAESRRVLAGGSRVQKSGAAKNANLNEAEEKEFGRWGELAGILSD